MFSKLAKTFAKLRKKTDILEKYREIFFFLRFFLKKQGAELVRSPHARRFAEGLFMIPQGIIFLRFRVPCPMVFPWCWDNSGCCFRCFLPFFAPFF